MGETACTEMSAVLKGLGRNCVYVKEQINIDGVNHVLLVSGIHFLKN